MRFCTLFVCLLVHCNSVGSVLCGGASAQWDVYSLSGLTYRCVQHRAADKPARLKQNVQLRYMSIHRSFALARAQVPSDTSTTWAMHSLLAARRLVWLPPACLKRKCTTAGQEGLGKREKSPQNPETCEVRYTQTVASPFLPFAAKTHRNLVLTTSDNTPDTERTESWRSFGCSLPSAQFPIAFP